MIDDDPAALRAAGDALLRLADVAGHHGERTWRDTSELIPGAFAGNAADASLVHAVTLRQSSLEATVALGDGARMLYAQALQVEAAHRTISAAGAEAPGTLAPTGLPIAPKPLDVTVPFSVTALIDV